MVNVVAGALPHATTNSVPLKRSIFNKPSWSKPQALTNGNDLFHRSNQTYIDLAAEAERQRKKKLARKERERVRHAEDEERAGKRQRVSESEGEEDDNTFSDDSSNHSEYEKATTSFKKNDSRPNDRIVGSPKPESSPKSLLKRYETTVIANEIDVDQKHTPLAAQIIDLEDDDDSVDLPEDSSTIRATSARGSGPSKEEDEPVSDEEFPELARQAREKARRKRLEENVVSATLDPTFVLQDGYQQCSNPTQHATPPPPPLDPVLEILITSTIPNTEPLIVKRKLSQRLKDVRLAWADRQQFSQDFIDGVFLIWRGKRTFDHTTCRSLGYKASPSGRVLASRDSMMDDEGRVHMEVMTREMFEAYKKAKANEVYAEEKDGRRDPVAEEQNQEVQIKIICKAKGFSDFKLIVKPVGTWI